MAVRVYICSGVRLYREGLALLLGCEDGIGVAGSGGGRDELLSALSDRDLEVVLLDTALPEFIDVIHDLREGHPNVKCVALGVSEGGPDIVECAEAGASGYVSREGTLESLIEAVRGAQDYELRCSPRIAFALLQRVRDAATERPDPDLAVLTHRELEIGALVARGLTNKDIAIALHIEVSTVKQHVHSLLCKFEIDRRSKVGDRIRPLLVRRARAAAAARGI